MVNWYIVAAFRACRQGLVSPGPLSDVGGGHHPNSNATAGDSLSLSSRGSQGPGASSTYGNVCESLAANVFAKFAPPPGSWRCVSPSHPHEMPQVPYVSCGQQAGAAYLPLLRDNQARHIGGVGGRTSTGAGARRHALQLLRSRSTGGRRAECACRERTGTESTREGGPCHLL